MAEQGDKKTEEPDWDVVKLFAVIIALGFLLFGSTTKVFFCSGNIVPPDKSAIHEPAK